MKAYEVELRVIGGYKDQTRTVFVAAKSKKDLKKDQDYIKAWIHPTMNPDHCPFEFDGRHITEKEDYVSPY